MALHGDENDSLLVWEEIYYYLLYWTCVRWIGLRVCALAQVLPGLLCCVFWVKLLLITFVVPLFTQDIENACELLEWPVMD